MTTTTNDPLGLHGDVRGHAGQEYLDAAAAREDERRRLFADAETRREAEQREADRRRARDHHARRRLARGGTR